MSNAEHSHFDSLFCKSGHFLLHGWKESQIRKGKGSRLKTLIKSSLLIMKNGRAEVLSYKIWNWMNHLNWSSSAHFCKTERGSLMVAGMVMWLKSLPTAFLRTVHTLKPRERGLGAGNLQAKMANHLDSKTTKIHSNRDHFRRDNKGFPTTCLLPMCSVTRFWHSKFPIRWIFKKTFLLKILAYEEQMGRN